MNDFTFTCFFTAYKFILNAKNEIGRKILRRDYIGYSPSEISTINSPNSQKKNILPREDSTNSVLDIRLDVNFDVLIAATNNRYADDIVKLSTENESLKNK